MKKRYAIVFSVLLTLGACASEEPAQPEETSAGGTPEAVTPTTPQPEAVKPVPGRLSQGVVVAASLDGSSVYVSDVVPGTEGRGCEGAGDYVIYRVPVDGSERSLASGESEPARGNLIRGGSKNRVALIEGCEENPSKAFIATESENGRLSNIERVPVPERTIPKLTAWSSDGLYLLGVTGDAAGGGPTPMQVVQLDPTSGDINTLFDSEPIFAVTQLKNGSFVTQGSGSISVRTTTEVQRTYKGNFVQLSPTGDRFAILGNGLSLVVGTGEAQVLVPGTDESTVYSASFSQDGQRLAYILVRNQGPKVDSELGVVAGGAKAKVIETSGVRDQVTYGSPVFTPDGRFMIFNKTPDDGRNPPDVVLAPVPQ